MVPSSGNDTKRRSDAGVYIAHSSTTSNTATHQSYYFAGRTVVLYHSS